MQTGQLLDSDGTPVVHAVRLPEGAMQFVELRIRPGGNVVAYEIRNEEVARVQAQTREANGGGVAVAGALQTVKASLAEVQSEQVDELERTVRDLQDRVAAQSAVADQLRAANEEIGRLSAELEAERGKAAAREGIADVKSGTQEPGRPAGRQRRSPKS